jgi:hypothetical protein
MMNTESIALDLIHELWQDHQGGCPHVRHDDRGCYCTSPLMPVHGDPYMPCDVPRFSCGVSQRTTTRSAARGLRGMCREPGRPGAVLLGCTPGPAKGWTYTA